MATPARGVHDMRTILTSILLSLPFLATSCSEAKVQAGNLAEQAKAAASDLANQVKDLDLSKLAPDALLAKGKELAGGLTSKLSEIKDKATAEEITKALSPVVEKLAQMKGMLADKMPSLDELKTAAEGLKTKFAGDSAIMQILQPLLDKLKALFA